MKMPKHEMYPPGQDYCPITGLQVASLRGKLATGICGYLAAILYVGAVQKSVERWSFWHDREVLLTAQRLVIADEEGNMKRFHAVSSITEAILMGDSRVHISIADGDLLLAFPSQIHLQRFLDILREVMQSLPQSPFHVSSKRESRLSSPKGSPKASPKGSPMGSPVLRPSGRPSGKSNNDKSIRQQLQRDREVIFMMRDGKTCPATSLPYASPPPFLQIPNVRLLYSASVTKLTKRGKQNQRNCYITYQKIVIDDPTGNQLKRNHSTYDVQSLRYCSVDNRMIILIEMAQGKDILLYFESDSSKSSSLLSVLSTLKGVQRDAARSTFKGIRRVEHEVELRITGPSAEYMPPTGGCDIFCLRGTHRQDIGDTFVAPKSALTRNKESTQQSPTGPAFHRTELWQQELQNVSFDGPPTNPNCGATSCNWSFVSIDSAAQVLRPPTANCIIQSFDEPITRYEDLVVPCDPSTCHTCASMKQQIQEISPTRSALKSNSATTTATNSSRSIASERQQGLRSEILSLKQQIQSIEALRSSSMESVDELIQKIRSNSNST